MAYQLGESNNKLEQYLCEKPSWNTSFETTRKWNNFIKDKLRQILRIVHG